MCVSIETTFFTADCVWRFEGGVLFSFSIGLAVLTLGIIWSHWEKCPKSAALLLANLPWHRGRLAKGSSHKISMFVKL